MEFRESGEDEQMRDFMRDLFAPDPDDDPTGDFMYAQMVSVEDVSPDSPDDPEREFIRALFNSNSDEN